MVEDSPNVPDGKRKQKTLANCLALEQNVCAQPSLDGGYSWMACLMGFAVMLIVCGQNNTSGIIFAALLDEYNTSRGQTGKKTLPYSPYLVLFLFENLVALV